MDLKEAKEALEIQYIRKALAKTDGNVTHAAKSIGISRVRFHQLLDKYGIDRTNFKD
jgi:DNA-binding NtrC family response regulator